jgi:hypothetical protein
MGRFNEGNLWLDLVAAIAIALSLTSFIWLGGGIRWWLVGGSAAVWLLWELHHWWKRVKTRRG